MNRAQIAPPLAPRPTWRLEPTRWLIEALHAMWRSIERLYTVRRNRRAIVRLARQDDRMLQDIGLSRGDVDWALSQTLLDDPSLALAGRVAQRRSAASLARRPGIAGKNT